MFERAVDIDPQFTQAYALLAVVDFALYSYGNWDPTLERLENGKQALDIAVKLNPDLPEVNYALASYYDTIKKDYKLALISYKKALEMRPNDSWINQAIGTTYLNLGEWNNAEKYLIKSFQLDPLEFHTTYNVASYYIDMRNWDKAEFYMNKAMVSHPTESYPYGGKATIALMGYGDAEKAIQIIEDGVQYAGSRNMLLSRYDQDIRLRRFHELIDAMEPFPDFEYYHLLTGISYWLMDEKDQANIYFDTARLIYENLVQAVPQFTHNYISLGITYAGLGLKEKAISIAKKAIELEPNDNNEYLSSNHHLWLARIYSMVGEFNNAMDEIELLLRIPHNITTWDLKLNPFWDPLRDHPRFQKIIKKYEHTEG